MNCGSPERPPPRRPAATGRLASLACLLLLVAALSAGPAGAYTCGGSTAPTRTLSAHTARTDDRDCARPSAKPKERHADPISFAFFVGLIVAVLLVPVALNKREEFGPE